MKNYKFIRSLIRYTLIYPLFIWPSLIKVKNINNIPKDGPLIICANHVHSYDSVYLIGLSKRNISFLAKIELFDKFRTDVAAKIFNLIPTKRETADIHAVKESLKVLQNGEILGVFPEGTRNGILKGKDFKEGAIYFALKANVPIMPVAFSGSMKRFDKKNTVNFGKPINLETLIPEGMEKNNKDLPKILTIKVRNILIDLLEEEDKKTYLEATKKYRLDEIN